MSQIQSDNFLFTNPKPPQEWQRKLVSGVTYADWDSSAEIDLFFAITPGLDESYKINKDFWIAGKLYNYDGYTYREIGGQIVDTPVQSYPDYEVLADANIIHFPSLAGKTFVLLNTNTQTFNSAYVTLDANGYLDGTAIGGFFAGQILTILYK